MPAKLAWTKTGDVVGMTYYSMCPLAILRPMKILIELPSWLGDAVMATPALENLFNRWPKAEITVTGSALAVEALRAHPRITRCITDRTKEGGWRPLRVYRLARELGPHDLAISFRSHLYSRLLLAWTGSAKRFLYRRIDSAAPAGESPHQVRRYVEFVNALSGSDDPAGPLRLDWPAHKYERPTLGINPGASYGSAKRWYPEKFAELGAKLASRFDLVIFGGPGEVEIAADIEKALRRKGVENLNNLAGRTRIPELCSAIGGLDLFVTGDSGPMHIAAAYRIPTVAIFGPTKWWETSQWKNPYGRIVRHDLDCAPCMKRNCPLKHHECMRGIGSEEVLATIEELLQSKEFDS